MEKSIKINIAGIVFQINEDAYELLRDYLQSITAKLRNVEGGSEMMDDIESRIAEIFQSKPSWQTAVISKEEVEELISTMGSPEEIAGDFESESYESFSGRKQKKLYRNTNNSIIGGVCSGVADYTGIEAVWIRLAFVLFTLVYFSGAVVYAVLWIALPGISYAAGRSEKRTAGAASRQRPAGSGATERGAAVGNAFNEIFSAFGKVFIIIFRIVIAIIGVAFILTGFSAIFSFVLVTFFQSTAFTPGFMSDSIFYLPDFFAFLVSPPMTVWLTILTSIVIILPLLALIYWGIRMVFQFRARDLALNLSMLIIWVVSCTSLAILLFTQGISFSDSGRSINETPLPVADTLYVRLDNKVSSLDYDRDFHFPMEDYDLYFSEENKTIYGTPELYIYHTDEEPFVKVTKYSNSRSRADARRKAEDINYYFVTAGNAILLDEYFSLPERERWSGSFVKVRLYIPDGYTIYFDEDVEDIMHDDYFGCGLYSWEAGDKYWTMENGKLKQLKQLNN
ncbi:MAG: PspC domain-containing protein [Bacteroidales bacterium]|nr:PspC domain-containing protein [Bacteroidales bacterium]